MKLWLVLPAGLVLLPSAWGAVPATGIYQEFTRACERAFQSSSGGNTGDTGHKICSCASRESKHEGVTQAALAHESHEIEKNPKYRIQDPKLLNAFHWCTVQAMDEATHPGKP